MEIDGEEWFDIYYYYIVKGLINLKRLPKGYESLMEIM